MAARVTRITDDVTAGVVLMDDIIVNHVDEDVAVWATGDVTMARSTGDVTTRAIAIIYVMVT